LILGACRRISPGQLDSRLIRLTIGHFTVTMTLVFATAPSSGLLRGRSTVEQGGASGDGANPAAPLPVGSVLVGSDRFNRVRALVVAGALLAIATGSVIAFLSGRQHTGVYLGGIGVVVAAGWIAAFVEGWTLSADEMTQRRPLFSSTVRAENVRSIRLVHDEFRHEIVISSSKWFGVELPMGLVSRDAAAIAAVSSFAHEAKRLGASVDDAALSLLTSK
jgi:hypothetical protein